jgi:hypothetical protein
MAASFRLTFKFTRLALLSSTRKTVLSSKISSFWAKVNIIVSLFSFLVSVTSVGCVREGKENLFHDTSVLDALEWPFIAAVKKEAVWDFEAL